MHLKKYFKSKQLKKIKKKFSKFSKFLKKFSKKIDFRLAIRRKTTDRFNIINKKIDQHKQNLKHIKHWPRVHSLADTCGKKVPNIFIDADLRPLKP